MKDIYKKEAFTVQQSSIYWSKIACRCILYKAYDKITQTKLYRTT